MVATAARSSRLTYRTGTGATWQFYPAVTGADDVETYRKWYGLSITAAPDSEGRRQLDTVEIQMLDAAYFKSLTLGDYVD